MTGESQHSLKQDSIRQDLLTWPLPFNATVILDTI